tara:strand:- start:3039 stop:4499 length:1461 start_codon:yes stop_codon:yes gene_type:complete
MSVVPEQINYTKILPLAVESRARRRSFLPTNGQLFNSAQNNIIRIDVAANAFLDTKESYLRMRLTNTTGQTLGLDFGGGHGIIQRLRILQQGRVVSDVQNYNKLLSAILLPVQGNESQVACRSVLEGVRYGNSAPGGGAGNMAVADQLECTGAIVNTPTNANDQIAANGEWVFCIPLVNGLLGSTQDKLVPLQLLGSAPIEVEITLAPALDIGIYGGAAVAGYQIDDIRYMASLVEVGPEVDQHLREVQGASNGRLVLNGTDYTHYTGNIGANALGLQSLNIPTRRKSLKSVLFVGASHTYGAPATQDVVYNLSYGGHFQANTFQLKIGNTYIPSVPIDADFAGGGNAFGRAEPLNELAKCFGSIGGTHGIGVISRVNYATTDCDAAPAGAVAAGDGMPIESPGGAASVSYRFCPLGIDLEAFQPGSHGEGSGVLESGIDTASRSLDVSLNIDIAAVQETPIVVDMYAVYDSIYWIDVEGNLQVSM